MNDITSINGAGVGASVSANRVSRAAGETPPPNTDDQVEFSEVARLLSNLEPEAQVRAEKVAAIRQAIADGTYETDDKIDYVAGRLMEVLRLGE
ncbi:MAG: hypothetical protein AMXMBFR13_28210 [Phycisphaerae bacterium]|jgi:flagellar biosynthesis anti-sigma factor FlgM